MNRKSQRNQKIKSKRYQEYTVKDVTSSSWESIRQLSDKDLYNLAKKASVLATSRRRDTLKALIEQDLPIPPSFRNWATSSPIPDKFSKNITGVSGASNYLGDYDRGFATIDMSVDRDMNRNELIHKIRVASDFLDNATSTVKGWKNHLRGIVQRLSEKSGVKISSQDYKDYWEVYNKVLASGRGGYSLLYGTSTEIQQELFEIASEMGTFDSTTLLKAITQRQDKAYEEREDSNDYEEFFEYRES